MIIFVKHETKLCVDKGVEIIQPLAMDTTFLGYMVVSFYYNLCLW